MLSMKLMKKEKKPNMFAGHTSAVNKWNVSDVAEQWVFAITPQVKDLTLSWNGDGKDDSSG